MLSELTECTVLMLKLFFDMYSNKEISYKDFLSNTKIKLQFLSENIDVISSDEDKKIALDIMLKCNTLAANN